MGWETNSKIQQHKLDHDSMMIITLLAEQVVNCCVIYNDSVRAVLFLLRSKGDTDRLNNCLMMCSF